jgi:RHS repeat-associated protein
MNNPSSCRRGLQLLSAFVLMALFGTVALGQQTAARPDRGTMPGATYQVSDIESISLSNGNVNLSIPLASLPPMAGGKLSWTLSAQYNSKIWNVNRSENEVDTTNWHPFDVDMPQLSDVGGWRISGQYQVIIRNAHEDYDYLTSIPPGSIPYAEYMLRMSYSWFKVVLQMPDGSEHELRPVDYSPYSASEPFLKGYYSQDPYANGTMRYYSFDGSYLYAQVTSVSNWIVFLPDGTKVIQTSDGVQRVQDTNGNKVKIFSDTNGTHYQDEQTGREIRYAYDPSGNGGKGQGKVWYQTVTGTSHHIDINFDSTYVQGQVYKVKDWIDGQISPNPCTHFNQLDQEVPVISEIVLPQTESGVTRKFVFTYNSDTTESATTEVWWNCGDSPENYTRTASKGWGSLNQITTPSGAVIDYTYSGDAYHAPLLSFSDNIARETITQKELTHDGITDTWTYSIFSTGGGSVSNPDGSTLTQGQIPHDVGYAWAYGKAGLTVRIEQPFQKIEKHWSDIVFSGGALDSASGPVNFNSVVDAEYTTLLDGSGNALKMSARTYQFDYNGNVIGQTDYDWFDPSLVSRDSYGIPTGVPSGATVLRTTSNSYYNAASSSSSGNVYAKRSLTYGTPLILSALQESTTGAAVAHFSYDGNSYGTAPGVGNLTSKSVYDDVDSKWITTSTAYNSYGNPTSSTDGRGKVTYFYYDDYTYALPTRVVADPQNSTGSQTTSRTYDYYTGLVTSATDANSQTTTIDYTNQLLNAVDPFGRPGVVIAPAVTIGSNSYHRRVTTTYVDHLLQVISEADVSAQNDKLLKTRTTTDQLGRPILSEQTEDGTNYTVFSKKAYDSVNRITYSSNPMRCTIQSGTNSCSSNPLQYVVTADTNGWTRTTADALGRVTEVASFSGASQPSSTGTTNSTGSVNTSYNANFTTVTDQASKTRRSMVDGLGRLVRIDEPDSNGSLGSTSSPNQATSYDYDVFGNLLHVYQGSQTRTFTYDSLSRLRTANNPESGTITFAYDDNGNLTSKTDARSVTTTIAYDSINRPTAKSYSDSTPTVSYFYDSQSLPSGAPSYSRGYATGRLVACIYGSGSEGTYRGYDELGQVVRQYQRTDSVNYLVEASYNLAGGTATETYPSVPGASDRRTVSFSYDNAARLSSLSSSATSYAPAASVSSISYAPTNALASQTYGNNLIHAVSYNSRQQTSEIKLGTSSNSTSVLDLTYSYGTTSNNGNLQSVTYAGGGLSYTQSFTYDSLNRLNTATETNGGNTNWSQTNAYDRYGNRQISLGGGNYNLSFSSSTNRITTSGYSYDSAGNLTNDTVHAYTFDGENRIKTVDSTTAYVYDGEGQRVRKLVGENTRFIYGIGGQLFAEFDGSSGNLLKEYISGLTLITIEPTAVNSNGTQYATSDHLGSPRVITNSSASMISRHDYMPFGEELFAGTGGRSTTNGFSASDGLRQKFTQYEHDSESNLEFAQARYYSSYVGRFTSTDPILSTGSVFEPQSWNRFSYVKNNPLNRVDPSGLWDWGVSLGGTESDDDIRRNVCKESTCTKDEIKAGKRTEAESQGILTGRAKFLAAIAFMNNLLNSQSLSPQERDRIRTIVAAYGDKEDHNGVFLESGQSGVDPETISGLGMSFVYLDFSQQGTAFNFDAVHEGQHVADYANFYFAQGSDLTLFDYEVRGFEAAGIAAKGRGLSRYPTQRNTPSDEVLWDQSWSGWKVIDIEAARTKGAMNRVSNTKSYGVNQQNKGRRMSSAPRLPIM